MKLGRVRDDEKSHPPTKPHSAVTQMGKIADKYKRRIATLDREQARFRGDVAKILVSALQEATDAELYRVTRLPTTGKMRASIQPYFLGNNSVAVGFNPSKARHALRRLNMKGTSKTGGHKLDMNPAPFLRRLADPKIKRLARAMQKRILNP
jgi:hypothetical protein